MGLVCKVVGHKWNGCVCARCGESNPDWRVEHEWGAPKPRSRKVHRITCVRCGDWRERPHGFEMAEGWNSVIVGNIVVTTQPTLADRYKGGFLRTLAQARELISRYESGTAVEALQYTIDQYASFVSTSPTQYTQATAALQKAIAKFNASPDKVAALHQVEAIEDLAQPRYNLQGQRTQSNNGITVQGNKKILWNAGK